MGKEINWPFHLGRNNPMSMDNNHLHSCLFSINNRILKYCKNNESYQPQGFRNEELLDEAWFLQEDI